MAIDISDMALLSCKLTGVSVVRYDHRINAASQRIVVGMGQCCGISYLLWRVDASKDTAD